jgi:hypothetical protein
VTTDRLLDVLSANLEPVTGDELRKGVMLALTIGGAAALGLMLITVGPRPELSAASHLNWLALKLLFALSLVAASTPALIKSLRPGAEDETQFKLIFSPLVVVGITAVANLLLTRSNFWKGMLLGAHPMSSVRCVLLTLFFATIPMTILMLALRRGAPTASPVVVRSLGSWQERWAPQPMRSIAVAIQWRSLPSGIVPE